MVYMLHRRPPRLIRRAALLFFVVFLLGLRQIYFADRPVHDFLSVPGRPLGQAARNGAAGETHPIEQLINAAHDTVAQLLAKETHTLEEAAEAYRHRRRRHPPPGFGLWYEFAAARNGVMVEDFFDQIYHDLEPFWALDAAKIRKDADEFEMVIRVRNGRATTGSDWFWTTAWLDLVRTIEHLLPDMDIAVNPMDEPRVVAPWERVSRLVSKAASGTKRLPSPDTVVTAFQNLAPPGKHEGEHDAKHKKFNTTGPYWDIAKRGCPPGSPARNSPAMASFDHKPDTSGTNAAPHTRNGFVSNYSMSTDFCHQPAMQGLHGIFIEPLSITTTGDLIPLFGGSKLSVNNEILWPAAMYWRGGDKFLGDDTDAGQPWDSKLDAVVWRGVASGGRNRESNWRGFHRHRFVAMNNASMVADAERGRSAPNFELPGDEYESLARGRGHLASWMHPWADVGFVNLMCTPLEQDTERCSYTDPYFDKVPTMPMAEQFRFKYMPDIDGNSFSGRYLGMLRSTSLPIKATLWREWHDSRLVAWEHFVPMDNRFSDYYAIMEYFLGFDGEPGHDEAAQKIATDGRAWAAKVLRREDMQIYTLRLLLEYGRVSDGRRMQMGWVEDLKSSKRRS